MSDNYPAEICLECGNKHGKARGYAVGMWTGRCGWCGKEGPVCAPRDFGYPEDPCKEYTRTS